MTLLAFQKCSNTVIFHLLLQSFLKRRHFFNHPETGYFKIERENVPPALSMMGGNQVAAKYSVVCMLCFDLIYFCLDPSMALDMFKSTFTNVLPMIVIGGWINWTFSGFLASELFNGRTDNKTSFVIQLFF